MFAKRHSRSSARNGGSQGLVQGAAALSIWPGERLRKKAWICLSRPGQVTAVLAT